MVWDRFRDDEFRTGWQAVLACFGVALFVRGFTSYGQAVFLNQLQSLRGWSASLIGGATTVSFICAALLLPWVGPAINRFGARAILGGGLIVVGTGSTALSASTSLWLLYLFAIVVGIGSAAASTTAVSIALAQTFQRGRGFAINLALSGISVGGFTVAPALLTLAQRHGFTRAVGEISLGLLVVVLPLIYFGLKPAASRGKMPASTAPSRSSLLRNALFWSVAGPFAFALAAQVGILIYQVDYLIPLLGIGGTSLAVICVGLSSFASRVGVGTIIDRLPPRAVSAALFAIQAVSTGILLLLPHYPWALYFGSLLFGIAAGNVLTLPSLIIQREFAPVAFGGVLGLLMAIVQFAAAAIPVILGLVYDASGSYGPVLGICIGLPAAAALAISRAGSTTAEVEVGQAAG